MVALLQMGFQGRGIVSGIEGAGAGCNFRNTDQVYESVGRSVSCGRHRCDPYSGLGLPGRMGFCDRELDLVSLAPASEHKRAGLIPWWYPD